MMMTQISSFARLIVFAGLGIEGGIIPPAAEGAVADGRVLRGAGDDLRFLDGVDHRRDDAPRARIEHALDILVMSLWQTHHRRAARAAHRHHHQRDRFDVYRVVLPVNRQPVEADRRHRLDRERRTVTEPCPDRWPSLSERALDVIFPHDLLFSSARAQ